MSEIPFYTQRKKIVLTADVMLCNCGGEFNATGNILPIDPPQYQHICSLCQAEEFFSIKYPNIVQQEVVVPDYSYRGEEILN